MSVTIRDGGVFPRVEFELQVCDDKLYVHLSKRLAYSPPITFGAMTDSGGAYLTNAHDTIIAIQALVFHVKKDMMDLEVVGLQSHDPEVATQILAGFLSSVREPDAVALNERLKSMAVEVGMRMPDSSLVATIGFMMYPLLREIGREDIAKDTFSNMGGSREWMRGTFRDIVLKITGSKAPTLLKALWPRLCRPLSPQQMKFNTTEISAGAADMAIEHITDAGAQNIITTNGTGGNITINYGYPNPATNTAIYLARDLLKFFPLEYVIRIINSMDVVTGYGYWSGDRMNVLRNQFADITIVKFIESAKGFGWIMDISRMLEEYGEPSSIPLELREEFPNGLKVPSRWKTGKELHDKISSDYTKIKEVASNVRLSETGVWSELDGMTGRYTINGPEQVTAEFEFVLPKDTATIVSWGQNLHNCIASYAGRMVKHETLLVAVKKNGVLSFAMELPHPEQLKNESLAQLERFQVRQLVGDKNSAPSPEDRETILQMVDKWFIEHVVPPLDPHGELYGRRKDFKPVSRILEVRYAEQPGQIAIQDNDAAGVR